MNHNGVILTSAEQLEQLIARAVKKTESQTFLEGIKRPWLYLDEVINHYFAHYETGKPMVKEGTFKGWVKDNHIKEHYVGGRPVYSISDLDKLPKLEKFTQLKVAS